MMSGCLDGNGVAPGVSDAWIARSISGACSVACRIQTVSAACTRSRGISGGTRPITNAADGFCGPNKSGPDRAEHGQGNEEIHRKLGDADKVRRADADHFERPSGDANRCPTIAGSDPNAEAQI